MKLDVRIEPPNGLRRADPPDQVLALEKLERAINRGGRHSCNVSGQPPADRVRGRMREVLRQRPVDGEPLRRNSYAPRSALLLERGAPPVYLVPSPVSRLCAT